MDNAERNIDWRQQAIVFDAGDKKRRREEYDRVKSDVFRLEKKNFSRLILVRSGKEWLKMGGNSMLIYYYDIAKKILDLRPNIQPDTDFSQVIFEEGVISFRGYEGLEKKLRKAQVFKSRKVGRNVVEFELNFSVGVEEMKYLREEMIREREKAMAVLKPRTILYPKIYEKIRRVQKRVFEATRKMTVFERDYNGLLIAEYSRKIAKFYLMLNNGMIPEIEGWKKITELINLLIVEMSFATELREIKQELAIAVGAELIEVRREVEKRIKEKM
ncbi:hypothetical protein IKG02_02805 [Candidatus Saccharibacteria bacterium]|nr:hypothetical protein [Candidatus Saccharibacteria bacterium]